MLPIYGQTIVRPTPPSFAQQIVQGAGGSGSGGGESISTDPLVVEGDIEMTDAEPYIWLGTDHKVWLEREIDSLFIYAEGDTPDMHSYIELRRYASSYWYIQTDPTHYGQAYLQSSGNPGADVIFSFTVQNGAEFATLELYSNAVTITGAKTLLAPSTAGRAALNIPTGVETSSPVEGDIEYVSPKLSHRGAAATKTVPLNLSGRSNAQTAAVASVAALTVGDADASYLVAANVRVATSTTHNFTVTVAYTDEGNTARTLTLTFSQLAGTLLSAITNITGAGPYSGLPLLIRAKAGTTITIATTGTFTTVTYNVEGMITQVG